MASHALARSRARWRPAVAAIFLLAGLGRPAAAQFALPEQRVTYPNAFQLAYQLAEPGAIWAQGAPTLSAAGPYILGIWADEIAPHISIGVAHSSASTQAWTMNEPLLPFNGFGGVGGPHAGFVDRTGRAGILNTISELYHSTSSLSGAEFGPAVLAAENSSATQGADLRSIANDPTLGYIYATFTGRSGGYPFLIYTIYFLRSTDNGQTWEPPLALTNRYCDASTVVVTPDGEVIVAYVDDQQGRYLMRKSTDHGLSFSPESVIGTPTENFGARPKGWIVPIHSDSERGNAYHTNGSHFYSPNYPRLAVDRGAGPSRGRLHAVWAERATGTVGVVERSLSEIEDNSSVSTAQELPLNSEVTGLVLSEEFFDFDLDLYAFDGQAGQTVYVQGDLLSDSSTRPESPVVMWVLYGTQGNGNLLGLYQGPMTRAGATSSEPSYITLPKTGRYYLTVRSLLLSAFYRLRLQSFTPSAGSVALDMRDIVLTSSSDGGQTWSAPRRVNHDPGGSDQHMPDVAVDERGRVYVAWYDRRGYELGDSVNAYVAVSADGGETFGPDQRLSRVGSYWSGKLEVGGFGRYVGDRIAVAAGADFGVVAWADFRDVDRGMTDPNIYSARIVDIPVAVTDISDLTASGSQDGVRLAWHVNDVRAVTGLRVHRQGAEGAETALGADDIAVRAAGAYEYVDRTAEPGASYTYRLRIARGVGADWLGPVEASMPAAIRALAWRRAWPNPFAGATALHLAVPQAAEGEVRVYDVQGHEVRTLRAGRFEPGELSLVWDGRDTRGAAVAPGVYFLAARVGAASVRMKLARVR